MVKNKSIELSGDFLGAIRSKSPSDGLTHSFYKYPACFSSEFARAVILNFSDPGDVVLDPFMGSGTTLVEALAAGRHAIGSDINPIAHLVAQVKTSVLSQRDLDKISAWFDKIQPKLGLTRRIRSDLDWHEEGYQKDIPWPIRKTIELVLSELDELSIPAQRRLARCALLSTGRWALDNKKHFPTAQEFRIKFGETLGDYYVGINELRAAVDKFPSGRSPRTVCLSVPAAELDASLWKKRIHRKPSLVVTSPPYPNVHIVYHQWQIKGRRRTAAPFWIIGIKNGHGGSHYTMGGATATGLEKYFISLEQSFSRIHELIADDAFVVQLIAFSDMRKQYQRYLKAMENAGFREVELSVGGKHLNGRVWREVPNRRWYAWLKGDISTANEVLLVHRKVSR